MTSHREAPKISKDPVADNTDLYAFVSPDKPDTVTILANYVPLEEPAGGPNFNTFGDDVLYEIVIDNNGDGMEDITYQFRFKTKIGNLDTFLYNTGPISSLSDSSWNVKQLYSVTRVRGPRRSGSSTVLGNNPTDASDRGSVVGIWASASRRKATILSGDGDDDDDGAPDDDASPGFQTGPFTQVSRLGMPLINEVIIPLGKKDLWNTVHPRFDSQFLAYYQTPELQKLLPVLYPGVFPNLAAYSKARADLVAILLTGIPTGIIPGFQNFTGTVQADYLRLNMAIPPNTSNPSRLGIVGGDLAGFPNGRRVLDDVVDIELRAIAGATLPLVDPGFTADGAAGLVADGVDSNPVQAPNTTPFLATFPYLPHPVPGYEHSHDS